MTTILGIDTALGACSAAIVDISDGATSIRARHFELRSRGHAERLVPMIAEVMAEAGTCFDEIDRIAVTIGPGSFTGLRVGLAAARGLALAAGLPLTGIGTLEAVAGNVVDEEAALAGGRIVAALDARRGELYAESFGPGLVSATGPRIVPVEQAGSLIPDGGAIAIGSGAQLLASVVPDLVCSTAGHEPDAAVVAALAARRPADPTPPEPLYLRSPDARLPVRMGVERQPG